ncbi:MAG: hypothetical protein V4439_03280 [Patescibacteria group bacterium]
MENDIAKIIQTNTQEKVTEIQTIKRKNHDGLFLVTCVLMFFVSFTPIFSQIIAYPLQTLFNVNPVQQEAQLEKQSEYARELAAKDPNNIVYENGVPMVKPLSYYAPVGPIQQTFFSSIIINFGGQITVLLLIILLSFGRYLLDSRRKKQTLVATRENYVLENTNRDISGENRNHWHIYIPFFQIFITAIGIFFAYVFGFAFDAPAPTAYLVPPILLITSILVCILSIFPLISLLKTRADLKKITVFIISAIIPIIILIFFMPTTIRETVDDFNNILQRRKISLEIKSESEFSQSQLDSVNKKLEGPLLVKSFGETSGIDYIYGLFYIEMSDGSIIVPLPQTGRATEEEVLNNLKKLVGKKIDIKLVDDVQTLRYINYPIHKNTSSFTEHGDLLVSNKSFVPSEFYFATISYNGKVMNLLDSSTSDYLK